MASLETIIETINRRIPNHDRRIIKPFDMRMTGTASCFGRAALVGAAMLENGFSEDTLSMLIEKAHGMEKGSDSPDRWYGHAALVLDSGNERLMVETGRRLSVEDLSATTWRPGVRPEDQGTVVVEAYVPNLSVLAYMGDVVGSQELLEARGHFGVYGFREGVDQYQAGHPALATQPRHQVADYTALYNELAQNPS